jgi:hypothetical protein
VAPDFYAQLFRAPTFAGADADQLAFGLGEANKDRQQQAVGDHPNQIAPS